MNLHVSKAIASFTSHLAKSPGFGHSGMHKALARHSQD